MTSKWGPVFTLPNVGIHAHVLPTGKVLFWGRRDQPGDSLDVHECTPFIWDPVHNTTSKTPQPTLADGTKINLFCSGHVFLPDGRLLVMGGHVTDGNGLNQACIYDSAANSWTATGTMNAGRWYPTAVALADGSVLVSSGSFLAPNGQTVLNNIQQIWTNGVWHSIVDFVGLPLFPRMHVAPDGRVFMSGSLAQTYFLDTSNQGTWTPLNNGQRINGPRDYAPAVMYDTGKILFVGGGNDPVSHAPTNAAEIIDLNAPAPRWQATNPMKFPRRQHNAAILPDGTVLVTGGTRGGGGPNNGFNDLRKGEPVHTAELWDPATGQWTQLADEDVDRCYHATTVLLPDGRVLSAGGGEYRPDNVSPNPPKDSHRNAQIFSPPYLFKGARPDILAAPQSVNYGNTFEVQTSAGGEISMVSWIRLPSVTHSFDQNQRINFLPFTVAAKAITVTAPANSKLCPPGHYMLFLLNKQKVPSVAAIVKIAPAVPHVFNVLSSGIAGSAQPSMLDRDAAVVAAAHGTPVAVGVTPTCPYGISACWGGAYEALRKLPGVDSVRTVPNAEDSVAYVYLKDHGLPDLEQWPEQFAAANGSYVFRGVEVTLDGNVAEKDGELFLEGNNDRPPVLLAPLQANARIQWDHKSGVRKPREDDEQLAYAHLATEKKTAATTFGVTVIGPLSKTDDGFVLQVRKFTGRS